MKSVKSVLILFYLSLSLTWHLIYFLTTFLELNELCVNLENIHKQLYPFLKPHNEKSMFKILDLYFVKHLINLLLTFLVLNELGIDLKVHFIKSYVFLKSYGGTINYILFCTQHKNSK